MDPKVKVLDFGKQHWSKIMGFLTIFYIFIFFAYNLSTDNFLTLEHSGGVCQRPSFWKNRFFSKKISENIQKDLFFSAKE